MQSGCCGDVEYMDIVKYGDGQLCAGAEDMSNPYKKEKKRYYMRVTFHAVPGFRSCIQAGGTVQADKEYWADKPGKKK
jgi:hypothetical protein